MPTPLDKFQIWQQQRASNLLLKTNENKQFLFPEFKIHAVDQPGNDYLSFPGIAFFEMEQTLLMTTIRVRVF
jgi:hypothetical protein